MLVVVPTYKRIGPLEWSLRSVFRATTAGLDDLRLLVVSNHPSSHDAVKSVLGHAREMEPHSARWSVEIIQRRQTLPPIENWYGAILDHAIEGETVYLHGDDDLFCPEALDVREVALRSAGADMLISAHAGGLIFTGENQALGPLPVLHGKENEVVKLDLASDLIGNAPFIGNHTYRNTAAFREAFDETRRACALQDWLPGDQRELMLPFYLPITILRAGGLVAGLDRVFEWRGHDKRELIDSPFRCAHWNNGFLYGATLDFLNSPFLRDHTELDAQRELYRRQASELYTGVLADSRIPEAVREKWQSKMAIILRRTSGERARSLVSFSLEVSGLARLKTLAALALRPVIDLEKDYLDRFFGPVK